jgi:hypothetical protein
LRSARAVVPHTSAAPYQYLESKCVINVEFRTNAASPDGIDFI